VNCLIKVVCLFTAVVKGITLKMFRKFNISSNFSEISRNINKSLEVIMYIIFIQFFDFADVSGIHARNKLVFSEHNT